MPLHTAHKSLTAALTAFGCVVSRPATTAVKNGSQIADSFSITDFGEKEKAQFGCFSHFVKSTKIKPETLFTIFMRENWIWPYFDL